MTADFRSEATALATANHTLYKQGQEQGHYESYFLRANSPDNKKALWIRYTIFSPDGNPSAALAELWAIYSDLEAGTIEAAKSELPFSGCRISQEKLDVKFGAATLVDGNAHGKASDGKNSISWDLSWSGGQDGLLYFPLKLYRTALPKAKALVAEPNCMYSGSISVNGRTITLDNWQGSQNHNWGIKHTDQYAWGQVCGFDEHPEGFLEVGTGRIKLGPVWSPWLTPIVLRMNGSEYSFNSLWQVFRNRGRCDDLIWSFSGKNGGHRIAGKIYAPAEHFVGLTYYNPPGGNKICLNSKVATCELSVNIGGKTSELKATTRAAFEILQDQPRDDIPLQS